MNKTLTEQTIQAAIDHGPITSVEVAELLGTTVNKVSSYLSSAARSGDLIAKGKPVRYSGPPKIVDLVRAKRWVPGELVL